MAGKVRPIDERARQAPTSLRLAVALHCVNCMGGPDVPGVREHVRSCTAKGCALYPWRPHRWPGEERPTARGRKERTEPAHQAESGG